MKILRMALGENGFGPWSRWPLSLTIILATLLFLLSLSGLQGIEQLGRQKTGQSSNWIAISKSQKSLGPLSFSQGFQEEEIKTLRELKQVKELARQAHYPEPAQIFARYAGQTLRTDLVLEGIDSILIESELPATKFTQQEKERVPVVIPSVILDTINAGIASHADIPQLSKSFLEGKTFTLILGRSSFQQVSEPKTRQGVITGVVDTLGFSGPAVPLESFAQWTDKKVEPHTIYLLPHDISQREALLAEIQSLGYNLRNNSLAQGLITSIRGLQWLLYSISAGLYFLGFFSIAYGLIWEVKEQTWRIALYRILGAQKHDIVLFYLYRTLALGLPAILFGITLAWGGCLIINNYLAQNFEFLSRDTPLFLWSWLNALWILLSSLFLCSVSGLWPALKASGQNPRQAIWQL